MYSVEITDVASKEIKKICKAHGKKVCQQMHTALKSLEDRPDLKGKPLRGGLREFRSIRCGRFRVIYKLVEGKAVVLVVGIGLREDGSKNDVYVQVKKFLGIGKGK